MTLAEDCAAGLAAVEDRRRSLIAERLLAPVVKFWDGNIALQHVVRCENEYSWEDIENDTGAGKIQIDMDKPAAQWLWDIQGRKDRGETIDILVTVDYVGRRWSGFLDEVTTDTDDLGVTRVEASFLSDYEQLKSRDLWATPVTPAGFQPFKTFMLGGPTHWALGTALKLNLARAHGWAGGLFDPLADGSANYQNWPIVLKPLSFSQAVADNVTTGLVLSRFKTFHEAAEAMLEDADLSLRWRRYMPGDDLPWPGANIKHGTLVVWFEDNSSELAPLVSGSILSGIGQLASIFVSSLLEGIGAGSLPIENSEQAIVGLPDVPEYQVPGYIGTDPRKPYVLYTKTSPGVASQKATIKVARYHRLTGGGHSMPGVNELMSAAVQGIGDALAAIPGGFIPPLGGVADAILKPFYEDTVLAFMTVYLVNRSAYLSDFSLYEMWVDGADNAYTLSATMVMREAVRATETKFSSEMEVIDGLPWFVGAPGHGHFDLGNRVLVQARGDESGRIYAPRVKSLELSGSRGTAPAFSIKLGTKDPEDAFGRAVKRIQKLAEGMKALGVL